MLKIQNSLCLPVLIWMLLNLCLPLECGTSFYYSLFLGILPLCHLARIIEDVEKYHIFKGVSETLHFRLRI